MNLEFSSASCNCTRKNERKYCIRNFHQQMAPSSTLPADEETLDSKSEYSSTSRSEVRKLCAAIQSAAKIST